MFFYSLLEGPMKLKLGHSAPLEMGFAWISVLQISERLDFELIVTSI